MDDNIPQQRGLDDDPGGESTLGMELVTEAYYRYTDVVYTWPKVLDPWHRNAIDALLYHKSLTHPDHPLRLPDEEGITLFLAVDHEGKERLLFSLKQLAYRQYYVHEMRMTDPKWVMKLANEGFDAVAKEVEDEAKAASELSITEKDEWMVPDWVPLPDAFYRPTDFQSVERITILSSSALTKLSKQMKVQNKAVEREKLLMHASPAERNYEEAMQDNATPGPGLRRGPERRHSNAYKGQSEQWDEQTEATGWGGFPLAKKEERNSEDVGEPAYPCSSPSAHTTSASAQYNDDAASESEASAMKDVLASVGSHTASIIQNLQAPEGDTGAEAPQDDVSKAPHETFTANYHFLAQQALVVAAHGGVAQAMVDKQRALGVGEDAMPGLSDLPPAGRSLFLALDIETWEADDDVVLEVGWAAVWWQRTIDATVKESQSTVEEMRDSGHYKVQDHLLTKHNGHWKPDNRAHFLYGESLPIAEKDISSTIQRLVDDLHEKAGKGPIYMIIHSPDGDHKQFSKIGLDTSTWFRHPKPSGWEFPTFSCVQGIGKTIVLDTAILFAATEHDDTPPVPLHTKRSLEDVAYTLLTEKGRNVVLCGNAGNDAFASLYNLQVFLALVTAPSLHHLREAFQRAQERSSDSDTEDEAKSDAANESLLTPSDPAERPGPEVADAEQQAEDEEDSEDDLIQGVFYEDGEGKIVEMKGEDSDGDGEVAKDSEEQKDGGDQKDGDIQNV